jgi:glycerate kinase
MLVLVCPASFKGVLSARRAAQAMARGVADAGHEPLVLPLADGGEGTLEALLSPGGERRPLRVEGPYGTAVDAAWGMLPDGSAVVEMAQASGLHLGGAKPRPLARASTFGTGQLLAAAFEARPNRVVVGLGGSATNDGGSGALRALGVRFLDEAGRTLEDAGALARLARIDASALPSGRPPVVCASDVDNRLLGPEGATRMFGPQKGGTPEALGALEQALTRYARVLHQTLGWDVAAAPGAGAAGGLGAAVLGFLGAQFRPGIDVVMDCLGFDSAVARSHVLLTGEGRLDAQSLHGKAVAGVLRRSQGRPVLAVCGRVDLPADQWRALGFAATVGVSPLAPPQTSEEAEGLLRAGARQSLAIKTLQA